MTDYREISQSYAQGAIKAALIINGGAAVAVLSQFAQISELTEARNVALSLLVFCIGTLASVLTWGLGFISTRHVDRTIRGQNRDYRLADSLMFGGYLSFVISIICFFVGALILVMAVQ